MSHRFNYALLYKQKYSEAGLMVKISILPLQMFLLLEILSLEGILGLSL
jgi:hypothetical protein